MGKVIFIKPEIWLTLLMLRRSIDYMSTVDPDKYREAIRKEKMLYEEFKKNLIDEKKYLTSG